MNEEKKIVENSTTDVIQTVVPAGMPKTVGIEKRVPESSQGVKNPKRRYFSRKYKEKILAESDRCRAPGELGALLRREGLYSSHLASWKRQIEAGLPAGRQAGGEKSQRGRKCFTREELIKEVKVLRRKNRSMEHKLQEAAIIIDIQKKTSELLSLPLNLLENEKED